MALPTVPPKAKLSAARCAIARAGGWNPWCAKTQAAPLRGVTIVELEHAPEALTTLDRTESRRHYRGRDALVAQPLVRPFFVIMSHERADGCPEMRLAEAARRDAESRETAARLEAQVATLTRELESRSGHEASDAQ